MLYMGYVGFSVAFAFAISATSGQPDPCGHAGQGLGLSCRGVFTVGIALAWWAYYELGWGGWWFWDPVETRHALAVVRNALAAATARKVFKSWTVLLAIAAFSLSLLGNFLRSGVIVCTLVCKRSYPRLIYTGNIDFLVARIAAFIMRCFSKALAAIKHFPVKCC